MTPTEPTAGRDWWAIEDAPDVSATLREEDLHCEARYLDEAIRQLQALADRVRALEAAADRFSPVMKKLRQARDIYSTGGIAGAASYLKQMFDWYDAALRSGAPRTNTEENHA